MTIIDRSREFELRQIENEIWRIEREAHRQIDQLVASAEARRPRIDAALDRMESDCREQMPSDSPYPDGERVA